MPRLLTAAVGVPVCLLAVFKLPGWAFFLLVAFFFAWAALEFVALVRPLAPRAPFRLLLLTATVAAAALVLAIDPEFLPQGLRGSFAAPSTAHAALVAAALLAIVPPLAVIATGTATAEAVPALALLSWGTLYFAVPLASLVLLQRYPWIFFLLLAIVWLGDTAAYYIGSRWGRHKLAPTLSPKKSWEGAIAGLATSLLATVIWSFWREGRFDAGLLAVAFATAVAAQVGDLVESLVKRAAGVKDSGGVLPGHGGIYDRLDAMFLAAPVMLVGLWLAGHAAAQ
jgi:phosphatidate cytidylyltransferase